jgi:1-phosphatidylinositol-4-phosphate 5-kinase
MKRYARKSLLTRFCGMYGVRIHDEDSKDGGEVQIFTVMNAVFPAEGSRFISERYDLKGSTVGREVSEEELKSKGSNAVLKDMDLAREVDVVKSAGQDASPSDYGFTIGATRKAALLSQLREDVKLLVECQVMDYSLLVGVANVDHQIDESARKALWAMRRQGRKIATSKRLDDTILYALGTPLLLVISPAVFLGKSMWSMTQRTVSSIITLPLPYYGSGKCSVDGGSLSVIHGSRQGDRSVYYLGLIDFLQPWTTRKVLERKLKGVMGYDTSAISCVTPEEYAARFLVFLDAHIS